VEGSKFKRSIPKPKVQVLPKPKVQNKPPAKERANKDKVVVKPGETKTKDTKIGKGLGPRATQQPPLSTKKPPAPKPRADDLTISNKQ
jgi:hypothetical protein